MVFEQNFVQVPVGVGGTMIDPVLKLRLTTGRWNPESTARGGTIAVQLEHDPEIQVDKLTMPIPQKDRALLAQLGSENETTAFKSSKSTKLANIDIRIDCWDDEVALICGEGAESTFLYTVRLIEKAGKGAVSKEPWRVLLYTLESIPQMRIWKDEYASAWKSKRISLYAVRSLVAELADHTNLNLPANAEEFVKISSKEIVA